MASAATIAIIPMAGPDGNEIAAPEDRRRGLAAGAKGASTRQMGRRKRDSHAAEEMHAELVRAGDIQRKLYPASDPQIPGFEIAGLTRPCGLANGDCFDYVPLLDETSGIVVADVTGHGLPAALVMVQARAYLRAFAMTDSDIDAIVRRTNRALAADESVGLFVTCLFVQIDPTRPVMRYVNAGHPPGLLIHERGEIDRMDAGSSLLGVMPEAAFEQATLDLRDGDIIVLYTDGVTEARSPGGAEFGCSGVVNAVNDARDRSAQSVCEHVLSAVDVHLGSQRQRDDMTVVLAKVVGRTRRRQSGTNR